jgi:hypothetical protein
VDITNTVVASFVAFDTDTRTVTVIPIIEVPTVDPSGAVISPAVDLTATFASLAVTPTA